MKRLSCWTPSGSLRERSRAASSHRLVSQMASESTGTISGMSLSLERDTSNNCRGQRDNQFDLPFSSRLDLGEDAVVEMQLPKGSLR